MIEIHATSLPESVAVMTLVLWLSSSAVLLLFSTFCGCIAILLWQKVSKFNEALEFGN
jgi:hypothetical protein